MNTTATPSLALDSAAQVADQVRRCAAQGMPMVDYGSAHAGVGHPPPTEHCRYHLRAVEFNAFEHYQRDLTVRASAGMRFSELQNALRPAHQFLPLDADDDLTIGEVVACNVFGGLRVGFGSVRDLLLGLRYIDAEGRDIAVGGRTVKNVAGYDLTRFMVGSMGEFGVIHEVTLKTAAIPEQTLAVDLELDDPAWLDRIMTRWLLSDAAPVSLVMTLNGRRAQIRIDYFGRGRGCSAQLRALEQLLRAAAPTQAHLTGTQERRLEQDMADRTQRRRWRRTATTLLRVVVPPAVTCQVALQLADWAQAHGAFTIDLLPAHGRIFIGGQTPAKLALPLHQVARTLAQRVNGLLIWHQRPAELMQQLPPFDPPPPHLDVLARLRHRLDPQGLFNPGRICPLIPALAQGASA